MRDWTGSVEQREALTVRCRACGQPVGLVCVDRADGDRPLSRFPAHTVRVTDAARVAAGELLPHVDDREFAAVSEKVEAARAAAPATWSAADAADFDGPPQRDFSEPSHHLEEGFDA